MAKPTTVSEAEAREAAEGLWRFWRLGKDSLERRPKDTLAYGKTADLLQKEAARAKVNLDTLKKARTAADEYSKAKIGELCGLIKKHRSRFSATHLLRLLGLKGQREKLVDQAIRGSWTIMELEAEIRRRRPLSSRKSGGRRPRKPKSEGEALVILEGLCHRFVRWAEVAESTLPDELHKNLNKGCAAFKTLRSRANKLLGTPSRVEKVES